MLPRVVVFKRNPQGAGNEAFIPRAGQDCLFPVDTGHAPERPQFDKTTRQMSELNMQNYLVEDKYLTTRWRPDSVRRPTAFFQIQMEFAAVWFHNLQITVDKYWPEEGYVKIRC